MGINTCVSVTWKMLPCGQYTLLLHSLDKGRTQACHQAWILAVRANIDHRIGGIIVDVQHRSQDPTDSQRSGLLAGYLSLGKRPVLGSRRTDGHVPGKG